MVGMCCGPNFLVSAWLLCVMVKKGRFSMAELRRGHKCHKFSVWEECVVVKTSDSAWLECAVIKNIRFSMSKLCHGKNNNRFSMSGMCYDKKRQIQHC